MMYVNHVEWSEKMGRLRKRLLKIFTRWLSPVEAEVWVDSIGALDPQWGVKDLNTLFGMDIGDLEDWALEQIK